MSRNKFEYDENDVPYESYSRKKLLEIIVTLRQQIEEDRKYVSEYFNFLSIKNELMRVFEKVDHETR